MVGRTCLLGTLTKLSEPIAGSLVEITRRLPLPRQVALFLPFYIYCMAIYSRPYVGMVHVSLIHGKNVVSLYTVLYTGGGHTEISPLQLEFPPPTILSLRLRQNPSHTT